MGGKKRGGEKKRVEMSRREIKVNLERLRQDVKSAYGTMKKILPEAVTDREVKPFGNAAHIILPKQYSRRKAIVIIKK
jgi:putative transposon-encoded protein